MYTLSKSLIAFFLLTSVIAFGTLAAAQAPATFNYQGRLLQNTGDQDAVGGTVNIVFSIWTGPEGDASAVQLWSESWTGVSLSSGIFSVLLGSNGSPLDPADFQSDSSLFLQLQVDGEIMSPRQQLGSAPFALVDEPANELQDLSLSGDELSLTGSTATVDLADYLDDRDEQDLELTGNTLSLTGDATPVDLSSYLDDTDDQQLSLAGSSLTLTSDDGPDNVDLSDFLDDTDDQKLSLSGNSLTLTSDDGPDNVDLSDFLDNTDNQQLSLIGDDLTLSSDDGADTVSLAGFLDDSDNQQLSLSGSNLTLTSDDGPDTVSLASFLDNTDVQTLGLMGSALSISGSGSMVSLAPFLDNTDAQALGLSGNTLSISGNASTVQVATPTDVDSLDNRLADLETIALERTVFTSSQVYGLIDLGGVDGADAECQRLAAAAGLPGSYLAWISDRFTSPSVRFDRQGYFVRTDGARVADDWDDLTDGTIQNALSFDQDGTQLPIYFKRAWTGTRADGTAAGSTCGDWTNNTSGVAMTGIVFQTDDMWSGNDYHNCFGNGRLYCFEQIRAGGSLECTDCVQGDEIEDGTVTGDDLTDLGLVHVKCDSMDCSGTTVGDLCDSWSSGSRPIAVSPEWTDGPITGATICAGGHTCASHLLNRSTDLSRVCHPKATSQWDCTLTCMRN